MDKFIITGGHPLSGEVNISRSKNASLPIMAACLLAQGPITLQELPALRDVQTLQKLLEHLGVIISKQGDQTHFDLSQVSQTKKFVALYDLVKTMRASILVLGPLLARYGEARVSLPGGCAIGSRPLDLHLSGLKALGATVSTTSGQVHAKAKHLRGAHISLAFPSVGATENLLMAAALARGESRIQNAAREPEVVDLAHFINHLGGRIEGAGSSSIHIQGVEGLGGGSYRPIADRIEAATYLLAGTICKSPLTVTGCTPQHLQAILEALEKTGASLAIGPESIELKESWQFSPTTITTGPYPAFPTDVQAQMMTFLATVPGTSSITENIFENRFMHVAELRRLGADISLKGNCALVQGVNKFSAAQVMCTDLRASAALVLATLQAEGQSEISRIYHLERGYQGMEQKLSGLGAKIERMNAP